MRKLIPLTILFVAAFTILPVHAGWYDYQHNTDDNLVWHDSLGEALALKSGKDDGVKVINLSPVTLWGLHKGDAILAVDGHAVQHVRQFLDLLYKNKPAAVTILVNRGNAEQTLTVKASDYTKIVNPQPPQPPTQ